MLFKDQLNIFMKETGCNAKQISELSELSTATLSRYRNGERVPEASSNTLSAIAKALEQLSSITDSPLQHQEILDAFLACSDIHISDNESFRNRLNSLIDTLDLSITDLCKSTGYETSSVSVEVPVIHLIRSVLVRIQHPTSQENVLMRQEQKN